MKTNRITQTQLTVKSEVAKEVVQELFRRNESSPLKILEGKSYQKEFCAQIAKDHFIFAVERIKGISLLEIVNAFLGSPDLTNEKLEKILKADFSVRGHSSLTFDCVIHNVVLRQLLPYTFDALEVQTFDPLVKVFLKVLQK